MRVITISAACIALVAAALVPRTAAAEVTIGANFGSARVDGGDFEGSDTGWKLHVGTSFAQFIGLEVGYVDFGNLGGGNGPRANAWAPAVSLGVPLGIARIYGKAGIAFADIDGGSIEEEYTDEQPFFGAGLRFGMTPGLGFRTEYERYEFRDETVDMAQAGLELNF